MARKSTFKFYWGDWKDRSIEELRVAMSKGGKPFGAVTMADLVAEDDLQSNGVYCFWSGRDLAYVGMASSRALIERVPSHLDRREKSWFGTLLKHLRNGETVASQDAVDAALQLRLTLFIFSDPEPGLVHRVEMDLIHALNPSLNGRKRRKKISLTRKLRELAH